VIFDNYLSRWNLSVDGEPIITRSSNLLPVLYKNSPAILKIALNDEERRGCFVMTWWDGEGAAPVLEHDDNAILLERAVGTHSLKKMAHDGHDDEASRIICTVAEILHQTKKSSPPELMPLKERFKELAPVAKKYGGVYACAVKVTEELLSTQQDICVLHGDIHHDNILDFNGKWLAIDPHALLGDRGFDFANIFCNPDIEITSKPGRLIRQVSVVAEAANLEPKRLLKWIFAYASLSAAWILEDGDPTDLPIGVAMQAAEQLNLIF
jgi:streptomycin 6-kinase